MKSETVKNKTKTNLSTWRKVSLIDCIDLIGGGTPKTSVTEYWDGNIPWLSVKDFNNDNRYVYTTEKHISEKGLANSSTKLLQKDDIIISARGTVGELAMIPFPMAFNQSCYGIRAKAGIDKTFLYYLLKNIIKQLKAVAYGSVFDTITRDTFSNIFVNIPDEGSQGYIASILSAFDDKIALNNKINENLEQQAQLLYKQYFPYSVDDKLPDGWHVGAVGEIVEIHDAKRIPLSGAERAKMKKKTYPYYGAAALMDYVDDYIFDGKYLLLGEDGTVVDNAGYPILQYVWGQFWVNNHAHVLTGKLGFNVESLYMLFKQTPVKAIVTGAVQPKISQANLRSIQVVIPPENLLMKYNNKTESLFSLFRANNKANKTLAALRDLLLPKLMNGEIDVADIAL